MKTISNAIYFDGESSNFKTVSVRIESTQLVLLDGNFSGIITIKTKEINLSNSSFSKKEVKLYFGSSPEKMLWIRFPDEAQTIISWMNSVGLKTKMYGSYLTPTVLGIFASLILIAALFYFSIPFLSGIIANRIPIETEKKLGENFLGQMLTKDGTEIKYYHFYQVRSFLFDLLDNIAIKCVMIQNDRTTLNVQFQLIKSIGLNR